MNIIPYSNEIDNYLKSDVVIDHENKSITQLADTLFQKANSELDFIKIAYEYVRDHISHSADINEDIITCTASEVLKERHGICFAKSHLLAAILRSKSIPTGFCYQKLILDDESVPILIYHGLNGVYVKEYKKWIRIDARGNKEGVNAQFSTETEQLAFAIRPELGEEDDFVVYPNPDEKVLERLRMCKTRTELWDHLPTELRYGSGEIQYDISDAITSGNVCCDDEKNLNIIQSQGTLLLYKCSKCGKEIWALGEIPISYDVSHPKCNVYIEWSQEKSIVLQINALKKLISSVKKIANKELIDLARKNEKWLIGEMYLSEAEELVKLAKEHCLVLSIEAK